jgi:hypothetical protein
LQKRTTNSNGSYFSSENERNKEESIGSKDDCLSQMYEKPGRINNQNLTKEHNKQDTKLRLRDNLIEHFDFEILLPNVWKHFYSWYSADL